MRRSIVERIVLGAVCVLAILTITFGQTIAATKKAKEPAPTVAHAKPAKQQSAQGQKLSALPPKKVPRLTETERQPEVIQKRAKTALTEHKPVIPKSPQPTSAERQPEVIQKQAKLAKTELKPTDSRSLRHMKVHRKGVPKAVVQPRTDLMYHGMLESPQRYDPRRNQLGAGVPDPHTPELTHDHFQELDRNQDGTIDPVERTFGRPDMDRDLHDRRPR
jgi:hypothetical protein